MPTLPPYGGSPYFYGQAMAFWPINISICH